MWKRMKKKITRRKEKWTKKISHLSVVVLMRSKLGDSGSVRIDSGRVYMVGVTR